VRSTFGPLFSLVGEQCLRCSGFVSFTRIKFFRSKNWRDWTQLTACDLTSFGTITATDAVATLKTVLWRAVFRRIDDLIRSPIGIRFCATKFTSVLDFFSRSFAVWSFSRVMLSHERAMIIIKNKLWPCRRTIFNLSAVCCFQVVPSSRCGQSVYRVFTRSSKLPAKFQQTSSKHPAGLMEPRPLSAYQLPTPPPISCGLSLRRA